jgi:hypothetical protein
VRAAWPIVTLAAAAAAAVAAPAPAAHSPVCGHGRTRVERDPRKLLALDRSPLEPAMAAGLKFERPSLKPFVLGASLALVDPRRGPGVKKECGARVWQRTVVVYVRLQALPPSRSERVLYVGRFRGGYRVWQALR